jgi:L-asparagine transporter-like permease
MKIRGITLSIHIPAWAHAITILLLATQLTLLGLALFGVISPAIAVLAVLAIGFLLFSAGISLSAVTNTGADNPDVK